MTKPRNKQGATPKAPQNQLLRGQEPLTPEQEQRMIMIQEKGENVLMLLEGLTYPEAGMVLKTCENMLNGRVQNELNGMKVKRLLEEPTNG